MAALKGAGSGLRRWCIDTFSDRILILFGNGWKMHKERKYSSLMHGTNSSMVPVVHHISG